MTIESHTYDMHYLVPNAKSGKPTPVFDTPLRVHGRLETSQQVYLRDVQDFRRARLALQAHLGVPVDEFAWPYGWGTDLAKRAATDAGYRYLFTTNPGAVTPSTRDDAIPRIDIGYADMSPRQAIEAILKAAGATVDARMPSPGLTTSASLERI